MHSSLYDNFIFLGDFNATIKETSVKDFCDFYNLRSLINIPNCFKNYNNPTCIDLILTNRARSFQNSCTIETGLSDFHKMIVTVMKTTFRKLPPKVIYYRDFRNFDNKNYRQAVLAASRNCIGQSSDGNCDHFFSICSELLDWYAPRKKKFIRGNRAPFWNRELSKEVMKRTRLRNKFLKYKTIEYQEEYNKQRNYCVSLLRKTKRSYYENLNERNVTDTKNFWKTVKPYLSNKNISNSKITLVENDTILTEDKKVAKELNDFFSTIVMNLGISRPNDFDPLSENIRDKTIQAIVKYRDHPSIVAIRNKCNRTPYFIFPNISAEEITKEIRKLDPSKASHDNDIPTKIIKENADIFLEFICMSVNHSIDNNIFPSTLKLANITPVFKKGSANSKENYRPVSILPNLSKIFERCMFKHMSNYFEEHFLSKYQCGFRKGFSAQHCLMALLEKWKTCVDQKQICGALLTDLSKAFDCLPHDLIIAKLNAYGFSLSALRLIHDYLSNRKQRTKINLTYSSWEEILFGVPQGSILVPLLFNIFMGDLLFILEETDIASFADDTTPCAIGNSVDEIRNLLENTSKKLFKWFSDNQMKANPDKCHFLMSSDENINLMIEDQAISNSKCQKLLGIKIDNKLSFNEHLDELEKL